MERFTLNITGKTPLLQHNARLADKLDPITRAKAQITAKRKKTEEDDFEVARLEWVGGLYHDEEAGPYLPGDNIFKALIEAARKSKDGKRVEQGLFIETDVNPLYYEGPRDIEGMWDDGRFVDRRTVKQQMSRITRVRPVFRDWSTEVTGVYDPAVLDLHEVASFAEIAGAYIGVGDWRPKFGRFAVEVTA